jgi:hypothetical protein
MHAWYQEIATRCIQSEAFFLAMNFAAMPARKNGRAKPVVSEELDFAKIGIVLVILAAVALKAERLKIIELVAPPLLRGAIWSTWSGLSFAVDPRSKQTIQSPNITPVLLAPITGSN